MKRWAKSYSIVDHELLHGGYLGGLSHEALSLYLFYVVVGDSEGRSYYSSFRIGQLLRLGMHEYASAQRELIVSGLIECRGANIWVRNLGGSNGDDSGRVNREGQVFKGRVETDVSPDIKGIGDLSRQVLKTLQRHRQ